MKPDKRLGRVQRTQVGMPSRGEAVENRLQQEGAAPSGMSEEERLMEAILAAAGEYEQEARLLEEKKRHPRQPVSAEEMVDVTSGSSQSALELWGKAMLREPRLDSIYPLLTQLEMYLDKVLLDPQSAKSKARREKPKASVVAKAIFGVSQSDPGFKKANVKAVQEFGKQHIPTINRCLAAIQKEAKRIHTQLKDEKEQPNANHTELGRLISWVGPLSTRRGIFLALKTGFAIEPDGDQAVDSFFEVYDRAADWSLAETLDNNSFRTFEDQEILATMPGEANCQWWVHPEGIVIRRGNELFLNNVRKLCEVDDSTTVDQIVSHPEGVVVRRGTEFYLNNVQKIAEGPFDIWTVNRRGEVVRVQRDNEYGKGRTPFLLNDETIARWLTSLWFEMMPIPNGYTGVYATQNWRDHNDFLGRYHKKKFGGGSGFFFTPNLDVIKAKRGSNGRLQFWMNERLVYEHDTDRMPVFQLHPEGMIVQERVGDEVRLVMHLYDSRK